MPDDLDGKDPVPGWAVNLFVRVGKMETKMNIIAFLAASGTVAAFSILAALITGLKA